MCDLLMINHVKIFREPFFTIGIYNDLMFLYTKMKFGFMYSFWWSRWNRFSFFKRVFVFLGMLIFFFCSQRFFDLPVVLDFVVEKLLLGSSLLLLLAPPLNESGEEPFAGVLRLVEKFPPEGLKTPLPWGTPPSNVLVFVLELEAEETFDVELQAILAIARYTHSNRYFSSVPLLISQRKWLFPNETLYIKRQSQCNVLYFRHFYPQV